MNTQLTAGSPMAMKSRPLDLRGALKDFEEGQLCYVVARRYRGKGPVKLILHVASVMPDGKGFGYGHQGHYVVSPGTLMGMSTSEKKRMAARANGAKGGRPKDKIS